MESTFRKIKQNKYELTVELGKEELTSYIKRTEDRIASEVKIDGFRPGKAPRDKIRDQVGDQVILERAMDSAVQESLARAIEENKIEAMNVSGLNIKENSGSKLLYTVQVAIFPEMVMPDISTIKVSKKEIEISKKELDEALDYIRNSRSKFIDKEEPVEKGDKAEIDFEVTSEGLPVEGGVSKNHPLIIGDNKFIPGFEDQLIGMKAGEEKKFKLNAPADYFHKSVAGKELDFSVKMVKAQRVEKPALDDEFARSLGRFNALNELEDNIRLGLTEEKKEKERQRLRLEILSKIYEKTKVELPEDLVKERLDNMITGFDNDLHQKGMELSFYLAHLGKTEDDLRKDWRPEAEKQAGYALILRKIAKEKNIYPSPEEVEEESNKIIQMMAVRGEIKQENIDIQRLKESVIADLVNEKTFHFLETNCIA